VKVASGFSSELGTCISWGRVPFSEAAKDVTGGNAKIRSSDYLALGEYPVIDQGKDEIAGYTNDCNALCRAPLPCLLFGDHTRIFKYVSTPFALGADGVKVLSPTKNFNPRYLFHYFRTVRLPDNAGYSRHFKYLREIAIPKPSLDEQTRIATILDKADAIRRKRQEAIQLADEFLRSVFLDMFGDPAINPKGWRRVKINEVGKVITGNTPPREQKRYYGNHIEWIKTDNISAAKYFLTKATDGLSEAGLGVGRSVPVGSTLVTCIAGSPSSIGNSAYANRSVAFNQQINAIVPYQEFPALFVFGLVRASKRLIQERSTAAMKGMVSKSSLESVDVYDPPESLKARYASIFAKVLANIDRQTTAEADADLLFKAVSQRAFAGELWSLRG